MSFAYGPVQRLEFGTYSFTVRLMNPAGGRTMTRQQPLSTHQGGTAAPGRSHPDCEHHLTPL